MYPQTLYPKTKQVLEKLEKQTLKSNFYLAGGTGLALQLGHRKSEDLDFFTHNFPNRDTILNNLEKFKPKILQEEKGTLDLSINGVKVSFLEYKYPLLKKLHNYQNVNIADILDISCMKLSAISSRGSKKDFVDLYFILKKHPFERILNAFQKKFKNVTYQKLHILKSVVYFSDTEGDPDPDMIEKIDWDEIKESLEKEVKNYSLKLSPKLGQNLH